MLGKVFSSCPQSVSEDRHQYHEHLFPLPLSSRRPSKKREMAGLGRRTHYRKHLTDSVLNNLPEPAEHERIARVVATRGGNQFDICLPHDDTIYLSILPTKFHKLVWVKRGDYVLVEVGQREDHDKAGDSGAIESCKSNDDEGGIRHRISHILYKEQVKHLKFKGMWPDDDPTFTKDIGAKGADTNASMKNQGDDDGIVYQDFGGKNTLDDALFFNRNHIAKLEIQESSSSEEEDEE